MELAFLPPHLKPNLKRTAQPRTGNPKPARTADHRPSRSPPARRSARRHVAETEQPADALEPGAPEVPTVPGNRLGTLGDDPAIQRPGDNHPAMPRGDPSRTERDERPATKPPANLHQLATATFTTSLGVSPDPRIMSSHDRRPKPGSHGGLGVVESGGWMSGGVIFRCDRCPSNDRYQRRGRGFPGRHVPS